MKNNERLDIYKNKFDCKIKNNQISLKNVKENNFFLVECKRTMQLNRYI